MDPLGSLPFARLLGELGAKTPAPGGGAAAGAAGALAAALARMVVAYSLGRASLAAHADLLDAAHARLARAEDLFLRLADEDAHAYAELTRLRRLDEHDPERSAAEREATDATVGAPRAALAASLDLLRLIEGLVGRTNPRLASDLAVSAVLAEAAASAAAWNVRANLPLVADEHERADLRAHTDELASDARARRDAVELACAKG